MHVSHLMKFLCMKGTAVNVDSGQINMIKAEPVPIIKVDDIPPSIIGTGQKKANV